MDSRLLSKPEVLVMTAGSGVEVGVISHAPGLRGAPLNLPCWTMTLLASTNDGSQAELLP